MQAKKEQLKEKALRINHILSEFYGAPFNYFSTKDAISELVSALLSHRTKNKISGAAYRALRAKYPTWEEVMEASEEDIEKVVHMVTYPEVKANRIKSALHWVKEKTGGGLTLDFIKKMEVVAARQWLEQIPGVGAKTSAAVLNFSVLRMPALVVDTHHQRVAQRTGLVAPKAPISKAAYQLQAQLPPDWSAQQIYDNHQALMRHGQQYCYYSRPTCERCPINEICDYYQGGLSS